MTIGEVKLAYPYVELTTRVSHFTARDSTAIEWMILETIDRCAKFPAYGDWPVGTLFREIFMVADPNVIILPCLLALQDLGAVTAGEISDETDLDRVYMRDLRLTESGTEMQRTGWLPGEMSTDQFRADYDPVTQRLIPTPTGRRADEPDGIPVLEIESAEDILFPTAQIRDMLESERRKHPKGDGRFFWLLASTQIESIDQAGAVLSWRSVDKDVLLGPNMECQIDGVDDPRLNALSLSMLAFDEPEETENLPSIQASDPDQELGEVFRTGRIVPIIRERLGVDALAVVSKRYATGGIAGQSKKDNRLKILTVQGCEAASATLRNRQLVIEVPEQLLPEGTVFASSEIQLCVGECSLHAAGAEREVAVGYLPPSHGLDVETLIADAATRHAEEAPVALLALYAMGCKDEFLERVRELCGRRTAIAEKNKLLQEFNQAGSQALGQKCISQEVIAEILVDSDRICAGCTSIDGALDVLVEYEAISDFRQRDELYRDVLRQILSQLPPTSNLAELYRLWRHVSGVKRSHMNWVSQNKLFQRLYSERVMNELLEAFSSDGFFSLVLDEYTPVEQTLADMRRAVGSVIDHMPELEDGWDREAVWEAVLAHREDIRRFQGDIRSWRDATERFEERIGPMEEYARPGSGFTAMATLMERLADALAIFLEDSAVKYSRVVVVDACSLMNRPELISWFDDGKTMLVIPQTVLSQLDAMKKAEDGENEEDREKAYQAREAIWQIDNYHAFEWLNLGEVSDPSLLNRDLDPDSSDNRILSVALRYIVKSPILLTDDINFRNIADAQPGLTAMDTRAYEMKRKYEAENAAKQQSKKGNKKDKKRK